MSDYSSQYCQQIHFLSFLFETLLFLREEKREKVAPHTDNNEITVQQRSQMIQDQEKNKTKSKKLYIIISQFWKCYYSQEIIKIIIKMKNWH